MSATQHHALEIPPALSGNRLDAAVATLLSDYSRTSIKQWIEAGQLTLNGSVCVRPRTRVADADQIEVIATLAASENVAGEALEFAIAYEDAALIVVDKPAGLVVHPGAGNPTGTLVNGLIYRFPDLSALPRAGLVHRLDKETSGLLLVARTSATYHALVAQMARREIPRQSVALVHGIMISSGTVDAPMARDRQQRTRMRVASAGRDAVTHYRIIKRFRAHTEVELTLETGRTHQIRVHMQHLGFPLVGDPTYGARRGLPPTATQALIKHLTALQRQALHARRLAFMHPVSGKKVTLRSPLPVDLQRLRRALGDDTKRHRDA